MTSSIIFALISTILVSITSLIGIFLLFIKSGSINKILNLLIAFSVGTLLGNSFFHLIPESYQHIPQKDWTAWLIMVGFLIFFVLEQVLHTKQSTKTVTQQQKATYGYLSLYADGVHNFMDGVLIGISWLVSTELGIATTVTILFHEIPQEISDFGILLKAGFSKRKALFFNFLASLTAVFGTILSLWMGHIAQSISHYTLPLIAGGFIYLSTTSLLPELVRETDKYKLWFYLIAILLGLALMFYFSTIGGHQH